MEKERRTKIMVLVTLIVAILGLTVAFAALSTTLTINGTASVGGATWDVHFEEYEVDGAFTTDSVELKYAVIEGDATINSTPTLTGTSLTGINVTLTKPGDYVGFALKIVNDGTIDAKIESIEISDLCTLSSPVESCDWNNDGYVTQEDIDKVNDNISFFGVTIDEDGESLVLLKEGDVLEAGDSIYYIVGIVYMKITFNDGVMVESEATELPERDLTFNNLSITINYVQD